jgi:glycosyltransferase involved in cell wall biosynthesis
MTSATNDFKISVVIPAYNAGKYIARTIDSVLAQTLPACEIIVVDDGSTDNTAEILANYESKVTCIRQDNAGASVARNTGITAATGEWIAFLDADDEWLPQKLQSQTDNLKGNSDLVWTTANYINCVCTSNRQAPLLDPKNARQLLSGREYSESYFHALLNSLDGWTGTMLIKRDVLCEAGLFRPGQLRANDYDMWWRIAYRHPKIGYVCEPLAIYHLDVAGSIIRKHTDGAISRELIQRHLQLAAEQGKGNDFAPCAVRLLRGWMRSMLFDEQAGEIRLMLKQFAQLLPAGYKAFMWTLTAFPKLTAAGCRLISRIVRLLGLRKRLVRSR